MWDIVWVSPQGHRSVSVSCHFLLQAPQRPCSMRKRFRLSCSAVTHTTLYDYNKSDLCQLQPAMNKMKTLQQLHVHKLQQDKIMRLHRPVTYSDVLFLANCVICIYVCILFLANCYLYLCLFVYCFQQTVLFVSMFVCLFTVFSKQCYLYPCLFVCLLFSAK